MTAANNNRRPYGSGSLFQRRSGFWVLQFFDRGVRHRINTRTCRRTEAVKQLTEILAQVNRGEFNPPERNPVRVENLFSRAEQDRLANRPSSVEELRRRWKHLKPAFAVRHAAKVTTDHVRAYILYRREEGAQNATINRELATLKRMFRLALQDTPPPVKTVPYIPLLKEDNVRRGFVEAVDFARLVTVAEACGELWLPVFLELAYTYGWRRGELLGLRVGQVSFASRTIRLDPGTTKNGEGREVVMTSRVEHRLREACTGKEPRAFVFSRRQDGAKEVRDFRKAWLQLTERAGLPGLLVHDLRRSAAKAARRAGVPESVVMAMGGWKTAAMFRRYAIVSTSDQQAAVDRLELARAQEESPQTARATSQRPLAPPPVPSKRVQ